jgi:hypothetical protein
MATCVTHARTAPTTRNQPVRVLRWTFRRGDDAVVCELGLSVDDSAYELRINRPWSPGRTSTELFDDAMSAFERHAAIERVLVREGWMLEAFESEQLLPPAS